MTDNWTPNRRAFQQRRKPPPKLPDAPKMTKRYDIAFTQEEDGSMLLHHASCKLVRDRVALGQPVATLYGCEILPSDMKKCECMTDPNKW